MPRPYGSSWGESGSHERPAFAVAVGTPPVEDLFAQAAGVGLADGAAEVVEGLAGLAAGLAADVPESRVVVKVPEESLLDGVLVNALLVDFLLSVR